MSIGSEAQSNIHSLVANALGGAASDLGGGAFGSALVSGLLNLLWPSSQESVWDSIKDDVQELIDQSLDADTITRLQGAYQGLQNSLIPYTTGVAADKATNYLSLRNTFLNEMPWFQQQGHESLLLPMYVQVVNLYLGLLRDGILYGPEWGSSPVVDPAEARTDLSDLLNGANGQPGAIAYVDQWFSAARPPNVPDSRIPQMTSHAEATTYTAKMTLSVLDFVTWWPYFDPSRQDPPRLNREIFTESFWSDAPGMPGYSAANGLPDWGKDESLLTSITSWGVTRSTGVRAGYADGLKPVEGNDDGSPGSAVEISISAGDPIVSVLIASQFTDSPFTVPRFDKSVTIAKRSGTQSGLNQSNDPIPVRWPGQILDVAGTDSKNYFFDEHVVSSIHLNYWDGVPIPPISRQTQNVLPIAACNVVVGFRRWDSYADQQAGWRWCENCQGLFFAVGGPRICRNGQEHVADGSGQYVLFLNGVPPESEPGWFWCSKCGGIFKPSRDAQLCAGGGLHSTTGSADYAMLLPVAQGSGPLPRLSPTQGSWAQCSKCCLFFFSANPGASWCPADHGQHAVESELGHPEYVIKHT